MLALGRKKDQSIVIGKDIEITILDVKGDFVKLGIDAPKDVAIHRKEVYLEIQKTNKEAAKGQSKIALSKLLKENTKKL